MRSMSVRIALCSLTLDYTRGRDEIVRHVDELIDELARRSSP
jgi:hypothetical protein